MHRKHGDLLMLVAELADDLVQTATGHHVHRRLRRVMAAGRAWNARGRRIRSHLNIRNHGTQLRQRDAARPQHSRAIAQTRHDRGFESDLAVTAIEHDLQILAEFLADVLGTGRTHVTVAIRGRRRDSATEGIEQLLCDRMIRHPDGHGVLPARDHVVHRKRALGDQGQRTWPEGLREFFGIGCHVAHPALQIARMIDVHDHRMGRWATFQTKDLADCIGIVGIGPQAVDRFGRKCHQVARAQRFDGFLQVFL